jgi:hypothetical protein
MAEHAPGHSPVQLPVASRLKLAIQIDIAMQQLDCLMLSRRTFAPPAGQQE